MKGIQRKMLRDPEFASQYNVFMHEYEALGHMRPVPADASFSENTRISYIPHHGIWQGTDVSRKLRVVFNASCRGKNGLSLNECLHPGPSLQADIISIICQWRLFPVAVGADIEKMYRQILVDLGDVDLQRIVWARPGEEEQHFQLLTVTFDTNCAPYLALRVLQQLAIDEGHKFPRAARILKSSCYLDDFLFGADTISDVRQLRDELIELTSAGGFKLHKWIASHPQALEGLSMDNRRRPPLKTFSASQPVKTLGIYWDPLSDKLRFELPQHSYSTSTKRAVLSTIARIFDPLGWVSPVITTAKIMLQDMWRDRLSWDDELLPKLKERWN